MSKNIIKIVRGDTYEFALSILDESNNPYILKGNDTIYFGLMEPNAPFERAILRKKITADTLTSINDYANLSEVSKYDVSEDPVIPIFPTDTVNLLPGVYYYSVKLHLDHTEIDPVTGETLQIDKITTIINNTKFIIL